MKRTVMLVLLIAASVIAGAQAPPRLIVRADDNGLFAQR